MSELCTMRFLPAAARHPMGGMAAQHPFADLLQHIVATMTSQGGPRRVAQDRHDSAKCRTDND
jgi:hypothetical protein